MPIDRGQLERALSTLGELLAARGEHFEVVIVGGGNLILKGLISRPSTKDLDLLGQVTRVGVSPMSPMPPALKAAVADVGRALGLADDWMNLGPQSLLELGLPDGFQTRLEATDFGGLVAWSASRFDMICFKLYAAADQGLRSYHLQDLSELSPTLDELERAAAWTRSQDPSPGFNELLVVALSAVKHAGSSNAVD